ncbi:uncharacterized protein LOC128344393 isoform X1 [Hemicordylus capensis]|uniref:uncharacterized protein LOC128344393 isoform X1 n=1 Tax=Hemicordylus capensis TaxID=884348 RepID=UPI002303307C|nr:uncharacterized protein LOC128344393 isoform X1 [Hemicordylus capensis]
MAAAGTEEEETAAPRRPGLACPGLLLRPPPPFTAPRTQPGRRLISRATAAAPNGEAGGGGPAVPRRLPIGRAAWPIAERVPSGGRRGSSPPAPSGLAAALDLANPRMAEAESESIASAQWRLRQAGGEGIVVPTTSKDPKSGTLQGSRGVGFQTPPLLSYPSSEPCPALSWIRSKVHQASSAVCFQQRLTSPMEVMKIALPCCYTHTAGFQRYIEYKGKVV